jgi:hypothetical protein
VISFEVTNLQMAPHASMMLMNTHVVEPNQVLLNFSSWRTPSFDSLNAALSEWLKNWTMA